MRKSPPRRFFDFDSAQAKLTKAIADSLVKAKTGVVAREPIKNSGLIGSRAFDDADGSVSFRRDGDDAVWHDVWVKRNDLVVTFMKNCRR